MKTTKTVLCIFIFTLIVISCKAQRVISIENFYASPYNIKDGDYIKDVNGVLDKYVGVWKGVYENKNFFFDIKKATLTRNGYTRDLLYMRYRIIDASGKEIINTLTLPDNSLYVICGLRLDGNGGYRLYYQGYESECGQHGEVIIHVRKINNQEQMSLYLVPMPDLIDPADCPNVTTQLLPTEDAVILTKQ